MIRSFNYTARQRLPKTHAVVHLRPDGSFDADLNLDPFGLPDTARVFLEAYFKGTLLRFDFGTVGNRRPPADRRLTPRLQPEVALFRLKVVAAETGSGGLVLAAVERILPRLAKGGPGRRQPLFPTYFHELKTEVWHLEIDDHDGPLLHVDSAYRETARADAAFLVLVYPEVLRRVLTRILREHDDGETTDDWRALWLRFGRQLTGGERNPPRDDPAAVEDWTNRVVARFVERHKLLTHYQRTVKPEAGAIT